jgi:hypothetical protein
VTDNSFTPIYKDSMNDVIDLTSLLENGKNSEEVPSSIWLPLRNRNGASDYVL